MSYSVRISAILLSILLLNDVAQAKQRVCVVGAGMAGLSAVKLLRDHPDDFEVIAFDRNSDVGGLWIYTDSTDVDQHGLPVHSSVYKNLRTNLPRQLMTYPDYQKFNGPEGRSFVPHTSVYEYMRNYTEQFNLRQSIKLDTVVEKVTPTLGDKDWRSTTWSIETRDLNTNASDEIICDSVMVCNGGFEKPNIPKIRGMESFPGQVLHSHTYRRPEDFKDKTILVLGASASGIDISEDLSRYAKTIYLSHRHEKLTKNFPKNIIQVRGVVAANGSELTLQDGSTLTADVFLFCTGYVREFAFLNEKSGISVQKKNHVRPLYKNLVNIEHPSMAFIGIPYFYLKGGYFYSQVKYFINLLRNKITLPSYETMIEGSKIPPNGPATLTEDTVYAPEWDYNDDLAKEGGFEPVPSFYERSLKTFLPLQFESIDYHEYNLKFDDNGNPKFVLRPGALTDAV